MPGDPRECREHAARCAVLAVEAKTAALQATYVNLSRTWESLARELERAAALLDGDKGAAKLSSTAPNRGTDPRDASVGDCGR